MDRSKQNLGLKPTGYSDGLNMGDENKVLIDSFTQQLSIRNHSCFFSLKRDKFIFTKNKIYFNNK